MKERIKEALRANEHRNAVSLAQSALEDISEPAQRVEVYLLLADAFRALGENVQAMEALKEALDIDQNSAAAWNSLGLLCSSMGRYDEAEEALKRAYYAAPSTGESLVNLGVLFMKKSDPGSALQYMELALQLQPSHPVIHANLALVHALLGRLEEAERSLQLAVFFGFEKAEPIQERIDKLKEVREAVLRAREKEGENNPA